MADSLVARGHTATEKDAEVLVLEHYGLSGAAQRLSGERDDNFRLSAEDGGKLFMKVAHSSEEPEITNFQTSALLHLEGLPGLDIPRVIRTLDGGAEAVASIGGILRTVRLTTFLPGEPLVGMARTTRLRRSIGTTLARVSEGLEGFDHPAADAVQLWDIARASQLVDLISTIEDDWTRDQLHALLKRFQQRVEPEIPFLRRQVVHNDLSDDNMHGSDGKVTGVLDFGDMTRTAVLFDLAVAVAYQLDDSPTPMAPGMDVVAAFHERRPLLEIEVALLYEAIVARMLVRLSITEWRATRFPDNRAYILRNNPRSWRILKQLLEADPSSIQEEIDTVLAQTGTERN